MSKKISFCAIMSGLGALCIILSSIIPTNTVFFLLFSTLFTYICVEEHGIKYGILTYAVISTISFIIAPDKLIVAAYAVVVGYYPVLKHIIEHTEVSKPLKWLFKIIFCTAILIIAYFIFKNLILIINADYIYAVLFMFAAAIFVVYDIALTVGIKFYALKIRRHI